MKRTHPISANDLNYYLISEIIQLSSRNQPQNPFRAMQWN